MDAPAEPPKPGGKISNQRLMIIVILLAITLPITYFIYADAKEKSLALAKVEEVVQEAEGLVEKKQYTPARDLIDQALGVHLSLKFRNPRWEEINTRLHRLEQRVDREEPPYLYETKLQEARDLLDKGNLEDAAAAVRIAKDTATLHNLHERADAQATRETMEALDALIQDAQRAKRYKFLADEATELYDQNLFSATWERVKEARQLEAKMAEHALQAPTDREHEVDLTQSRAIFERLSERLNVLIERKKAEGYVLIDDNWVTIKDHAINRIRHMRTYRIEVAGGHDDQEIVSDTIRRVFGVIHPRLSWFDPASEPDGALPDMIVRVRDIDVELPQGNLGSYRASARFEFYEPHNEVTIWRFRSSINSDTYNFRLSSDGGDARTRALKNIVKDTFYKTFFQELPAELRKKPNREFASFQAGP